VQFYSFLLEEMEEITTTVSPDLITSKRTETLTPPPPESQDEVPSWVNESLTNAGRDQGCSTTGTDCRGTRCCRSPGMQCFEKNKWWASCREACVPGFGRLGADTSWTCRPLGPRTPDTRRHDEVVLRVVSAEVPANGTEVTVVLGQKQLRAQIFTQNKTDTSKALNVTQAAEARRRKGGRSGASNGTLDGAVRRKASSSTTTTTQVLHV